MYNWQMKQWAEFVYDEKIVNENAFRFAGLAGEIFGVFKTFSSEKQKNETLALMVSEAVKTSEIEGEKVSREDVRSSFLEKTGPGATTQKIKDKRAGNVALLMLEVRNSFREKLGEKMLKRWHAVLFAGDRFVHAGAYRKNKEPMQGVSGFFGAGKVHYEAPPAERVPAEVRNFVKWFNAFRSGGNVTKAIIRTAIAHLYFESIHPFEDGNGRLGRALIEKSLSQSFGRQLLMRVSRTIEKNRKQYYAELKKGSATLEINGWLLYFSQLLIDAQQDALATLEFSVKKAHFFDRHKGTLNVRQTKVVSKMLDAGQEGFAGGMTARKYISITQTTKPTATRDLQGLVECGVFSQYLAGKNTYYGILRE
ncbi:MAG: DUF4172 domain-containing protein [Opitutaceae bacterium]|jgi:Fic family protein|nr:DUF4172 domain-containing protein [Opitutaceae bacterium]